MKNSTNAGLKQSTVAHKITSKYMIYIVLVAMIIIISILSQGKFLGATNVLNVLRQVSITGMLAIGMTLVLVTGGIDLSVGAIVALTGVIASDYAHPQPSYPLILVFVIAIGIGVVFGLSTGLLVAFMRVPSFIVTLGMMTIARGASSLYTNGQPVFEFTDNFRVIGAGRWFDIPVPIYIFVFVALLTIVILHFSKTGRNIYAVGGNETAAVASGVNVKKTKIFVHLFCGAVAGLAGIVLASRTNTGAPNAAEGYELDAIAAAVIGGTSLAGGKGGVYGTIVGILIMGILSNGLDLLNISSYIQQIVKGIVIIGAVVIDQMSLKTK